MVYDWVQGRALHSLKLKNLDLEANFHTEMFPKFSITEEFYSHDWNKEFIAMYYTDLHAVEFTEKYLYHDKMWFEHVYFHELMHSTSFHNHRILKNWVKSSPADYQHMTGLEERIADIAALVLCLRFEYGKTDCRAMLKFWFEENKTGYALPWQDVTDAVLCYVKNKDCPKLLKQLQYVKQVITDNNLTSIYEGNFDAK